MDETLEIVTLLIALYGAVLATTVYVRDAKLNKPSIYVSHGWGYGSSCSTGSSQLETIIVFAVNHGKTVVRIEILGLELNGEFCITPVALEMFGIEGKNNTDDVDRHHKLGPGEKVEVSYDVSALRQMLHTHPTLKAPVRIRPYCPVNAK